jgi:hypothetical protein
VAYRLIVMNPRGSDRRTGARAVTVALVPAVTLAGVLTACGGSAPEGARTPSAAASASATGTPSSSVSAAVVVRYVRSGGLAGRSETLTIQPSGVAVLRTDADTAQDHLTGAERSALRRALDRARFPGPTRGVRRAVPDGFTYTVTVGSVTVRFGENEVPDGLTDLLRVLQGVANRLSAGD